MTVEQLQELVEEKELEDKSEEEVLVELEESISCFSNMLEVVKWAMTAMLAKASRKEISSEPDRAKSLTAKILYFYEPSSPAE